MFAICGGGGTIIRSFDEGKNWIVDSTGTKVNLNSISFYNKGFCVGDSGTILYYPLKITSVESNKAKRIEYTLSQNYPNPFNPTTTIKYSIPIRANVQIKIFDVLGKEVGTLVNEQKAPGEYEVKFDGSGLLSGIYFYRIIAGTYIQTNKMVFLK